MKKIARLIGFYLNVLAWFAPRYVGRKGFFLFCTPLAPPVKDHHRQYFATAENGSFEFEGRSIHTYRWGSGPVNLLFVHGWQSHSFRWKAYVDHFVKAGGFTVYALDAPAHGQSGGKYINLPLYSRVIDHFVRDVQPVQAIISHSFGSFASLHSLHHDPSLPIGKLVIMGTPGEANDFMQHYTKVLGLSRRALKAVLNFFVSYIGQTPEYYSAARFASGVAIPGLIVHDRDDDETPFQYAEAIHATWPTSILIATSGLGHNLKSDEVLRKVANFVDGRTVGQMELSRER